MARKRRGRNEGSISQQPDGLWVARISLGYGSDGRRKRQAVYAKTKAEVRRKLLKLQGQEATGTLVDVSTMTVGQYLDSWLSDDVVPNRASRTAERYEGLVRIHLKPRIGRLKLQTLAPAHVSSMLAAMVRDATSADTRKKALVALKVAMNRALRLRLVTHNPCDAVDIPKVVTRDIQPLTMEQSERLFVESLNDRLGDIFTTAVTTGLRQGELFALHKTDVNLGEGVLTVRRTLEETSKGLTLGC